MLSVRLCMCRHREVARGAAQTLAVSEERAGTNPHPVCAIGIDNTSI
jgi:hypothetical protein